MKSSLPLFQTRSSRNDRYVSLKIIALSVVLIFSYSEIRTAWVALQSLQKVIPLTTIITITLYTALLFTGLVYLLIGFLQPDVLNRWSRYFGKLPWVRWGIVVGAIIIFTYIYLYSPWQHAVPGPWSQLVFAAGLAQIILFFAAPHGDQSFGWRELFLTFVLFLFPRVAQETREIFSNALAYRIAAVAGFAMVITSIFLLHSPYGKKLHRRLIVWREKMGTLRFGLAALLYLVPVLHRYLVSPETYILYADTRFAILLSALWVAAYLGSNGSTQLVSLESLGLSSGVLIFTSLLARSSLLVVGFPFSLSWSEGNRFYDYSLMFGQSLYKYDGYIKNPYASPGRYGLWGVLFLWQGLPIWVHRLWNLILNTFPVLVFSILLTRKLKPSAARYGVILWVVLFLTVLTPLQPPFMIASIIMVVFAFDKSFIRRAVSIAIAGYYVAFTRFTWAFAPGAIGMLIDLLLYYPSRQGSYLRRIVPAIAIMLLGVLPGLISNLGTFQSTLQSTVSDLSPDPGTIQSTVQSTTLTGQQPLLWYRLLPNNTLGIGVLFLAMYYTLPLLIILAWLMFSGRWQLDWIQKLAMWGVLIGFFVFGLVVSAKIGGGGDLHNLDMYLITLLTMLVFGLMLQVNNSPETSWPVWIVGVISFVTFFLIYPFTPFHPNARYNERLDLPNNYQVNETLSRVQQQVKKYAGMGDVLFMDQRQLLTFGYVPAVAFVPDYEKKYLMDQAMANNAEYFHSYYKDLAHQRFSLIITEPLHAEPKLEMVGSFTEENNAWVYWVSNPTLCFYEPIYFSKKVHLQLLVPKQQTPTECEKYIK